jgi:hypothetical protein
VLVVVDKIVDEPEELGQPYRSFRFPKRLWLFWGIAGGSTTQLPWRR